MFSKKSLVVLIIVFICLLVGLGVYKVRKQPDLQERFLIFLVDHFPQNTFLSTRLADVQSSKPSFQKNLEFYRKIIDLKKEGYDLDLDQESLESISKVDRIIDFYKKMLVQDQKNYETHFKLADIYQSVGLYEEAFQELILSVQEMPSFVDGHFQLGVLYAQVGEVESALTAFKQTLLIADQDENMYVRVLSELGNIIRQNPKEMAYKKMRREALNQFMNVLNNQNHNEEAYVQLGTLYEEMGELDRAVSAYQMALDLNPNHLDAHYGLGNIFKKYNQNKDAIYHYQKVIDGNPQYMDAYLNLGIVYMANENMTMAEKIYQSALQIDPHNSKVLFNLGYVYESQGELQKAKESYILSAQSDPTNTEAYYNLGNVYLELQQPTEALSSYLQVVDLNPNHLNAWVNLSITAFNEKKYAQTLSYYDEAILLGFQPPQDFKEAVERLRSQ